MKNLHPKVAAPALLNAVVTLVLAATVGVDDPATVGAAFITVIGAVAGWLKRA